MIGLMDCNNFFVSCERLFRPDLIGKPVAVLSSNDGCVVARSQEIKDLGVGMGVPYFQIKDLCKKEKVTLFSSNFALYHDISRRVMSALKAEFLESEVYSVDEAFFTVGASVTEEYLQEVRARIMQKTGIPVSIGIAETKTLAKVAVGIAKKGGGVCKLREDDWLTVAEKLSVGSVWGIGRQTAAALGREKIYTVSDFLLQNPARIKQMHGVVGERLFMELKGVSVYKVGDRVAHKQESYMSTRSFGFKVTSKLTLMSALGHHTAHIAQKLREDACVCSTVSVLVRGSRFGPFSHRKSTSTAKLLTPTHDTLSLTKVVSELLDTLYDPEIPYKKAGVVVGGILPESYTTTSLFTDVTTEPKTHALDILSDTLNKKFGTGTIQSGITLHPEKWETRKVNTSKAYTTDWSEIAFVKAV